MQIYIPLLQRLISSSPTITSHTAESRRLSQLTRRDRHHILPQLKKWYLADWLAQTYRCSVSSHKPLKGLLHTNFVVHIDSSLSWSTHIDHITKKATTRLYFLKIKDKRAGLSKSHLLHFYITVIRPVLEYCAPVWHFVLTKAQSESLGTIQKRAIHINHNITRGMPYSSMLYCVNLNSLASRKEDLSRDFFHNILDPASCLHSLLPPPTSTVITSRLRSSQTFPKVLTCTQCYCSFIQYGLNHYQ